MDGAHLNGADLRTIMNDSNALDEDLAVFDRTLTINLRGHLTHVHRRTCCAAAEHGGA